MTKKNKEDERKVLQNLERRIRPAKHGRGYYVGLFVLFFVIPFYVLLRFFYVYAGGWSFYDVVFIGILLAFAGYLLYKEFVSTL